jgi:hypothetical protein
LIFVFCSLSVKLPIRAGAAYDGSRPVGLGG